MIKGKIKEEKTYVHKPTLNYRKLDALNQSMLKLFDSDPVKFFEEFKMGKKRKDKKNTALIIGDLVDFYLLACGGNSQEFENRFDEKFALFNGTKGTGQVFVLADILFEISEECLENGKTDCSFEDRFKEAFSYIKDIKDAEGNQKYYKGKTLEKVLEEFNEKGSDYFQTKMDNIGKVVVDLSLVDKAKTVARKMAEDPFTQHIFGEENNKEVLTHFPIEWVYGNRIIVKCKAEVDRLEIDHDKKIIQPDDLKTTYDNESFDYMYIKNSYYLQNAFYIKAVEYWAQTELPGYKVLPMRFIVGDTSFNNRRPLVYVTSPEDIKAGYEGFTFNGNHYRGVKELINEINWCEQNNIWNCSKEVFDNNGIMKLNIKYD